MSPTVFYLSFFCDVIFSGWIGVQNWQSFLKNYFFPVLRVHKLDLMALILWYVVDSVNVNMRVIENVVPYSSFSLLWECPLKIYINTFH